MKPNHDPDAGVCHCRDCITLKAMADAYARGFKDALESAAKVADRKRWGEGRSPIAEAIRALVPGGKP